MSSENLRLMPHSIARSQRRAVIQALLGLILCLGSWAIAWFGHGQFRSHTFFPLWFGYILAVDGVVLMRSGSSLLVRLGRSAILLFAFSVPFWWLFELANIRLQNWHYQLPYHYSWLRYHLEASIAFSTVVPAVFCTAELIRCLLPCAFHWSAFDPSANWSMTIGIAGAGMILAALIYPSWFFPLIWIGGFFLIDWMASLIGARSISGQVRQGYWGTVVVLFAATLWCGFLWELWNSRSMPKWTYAVPKADWFHIFEMPILGFGGYLPFGLTLYAFVHLVDHLTLRRIGPALLFDRARDDGHD